MSEKQELCLSCGFFSAEEGCVAGQAKYRQAPVYECNEYVRTAVTAYEPNKYEEKAKD